MFPIPVLDGGHLLFYAAEALLGRPLGRRTQEVGFKLGLAARPDSYGLCDVERPAAVARGRVSEKSRDLIDCLHWRGRILRPALNVPMLRRGTAAVALLCMMPMPTGQARAETLVPLPRCRKAGSFRKSGSTVPSGSSPETVRSYLAVQPGDKFDDEKLDKSLKVLFATGLFADVTLARNGDTLIVRVVENPIINRVAYEGNHHFDEKQLGDEVHLKPRAVYTRTKVQADVKRILDLYRRSGRFAATVEPKVVQLPQNRVDLIFEVNEGKLTGIESINFVGNKDYGNGDLQAVISTKESRWYRMFSSDPTRSIPID